MNKNVSRNLTLLRKEQGLSQKKVASDLGISQALLSHYEKGVRECGLDFLCKVADYFNVSCDFLLGRTPQRNGARITLDSLPAEGGMRGRKAKNSMMEYRYRLILNSLYIIFGILKKINSEGLANHIFTYLSTAVYRIYRAIYTANPANPPSAFSIEENMVTAALDAKMFMSAARFISLLHGVNVFDTPGIPPEKLPRLTPDVLEENFPNHAPAMAELIRSVEDSVNNRR